MLRMKIIALLSILIIQVSSMEVSRLSDSDIEENRFFFGFLRTKCNSQLKTPSIVQPGLQISLTRLANNRLYYFSPSTALVTFEAARTFCKDHGMHLVTINSERENFLVYSKAIENGLMFTGAAPVAPGPWIGLRDATGTNVYKWVQDDVGPTPTYFAVNPPTVNFCAGYLGNANTNPLASWNSIICTTLRPFICELEPPCSLFL